MCEQCSAGAVDVGEFAPGWWLVRATRDGRVMVAGQYALVRGNDPDFYLPEAPIPAPDREIEDDTPEGDPILAEWERFDESCRRIGPALATDPEIGWALVNACLDIPEDGRWCWDKAGCGFHFFEDWLCDRLGRMIRETSAPGR